MNTPYTLNELMIASQRRGRTRSHDDETDGDRSDGGSNDGGEDVKPTRVELMMATMAYQIEEMQRAMTEWTKKASVAAAPSPVPATTTVASTVRAAVLIDRIDGLKRELESEKAARLALERTIERDRENVQKTHAKTEAFAFNFRSLFKIYGAAVLGGPVGWHHYLRGDHALALGYCMTCGGMGLGVALDLVTMPFQTHHGFIGRAIRWIQSFIVIDTAVFAFNFHVHRYVVPFIAAMSTEQTTTAAVRGWSFPEVLAEKLGALVTSPLFTNFLDSKEISLAVALFAAVTVNEVRVAVAIPMWLLFVNTRSDAKRDEPYSVLALAFALGRVLEYILGFRSLSLKAKYVRTMERNRRIEAWMVLTAILLIVAIYFGRLEVSQAYVDRFVHDLEAFTMRFENVTVNTEGRNATDEI